MAIINSIKLFIRKALGLTHLENQVISLQQQQSQTIELLEKLNQQLLRETCQELVTENKSGSILTCQMNDMEVLAPVEMLRIYPHCLHPKNDKKLTYYVETHCSNWLCSQIKEGDTVLDIGSAFGVIALPLSRAVGSQGHVYAFEPAKRTQHFLQQIVDLNHLDNVTVVKAAIADKPGEAEFIEYTPDNELTWASDVSTLNAPTVSHSLKHETYKVEVTTIDDYVAAHNLQPKALKIDIEGFELYALHGAKTTLTTYLPYLCIDIHKDVQTGESALLGVEPFLSHLGYETRLEGHTLLCIPAKTHQ
ncbi:FkbM family methyltransferase [Aphanothece sacrum]|uniref:FkbM family methyltransferase n=1 Tax=Aphanothece sacrum TaxID=1122 RepID=UPI000F610C12|nr:FkbM family methyltransferase [Aphanothece sacrum]GBF86483.1 methyltransferase [Aphanothece sacrum FPU3]